jgi:hypothetical protein
VITSLKNWIATLLFLWLGLVTRWIVMKFLDAASSLLTVLIEMMHREGFELEVGPPTVIYKENEEMDKIEESWEIVEIHAPEEYGKGELQDMGINEGEGKGMS